MKSKWSLFVSIFQLIIGTLAIFSFIIIAGSGTDVKKWTVTFVLAIVYVILGIIGIVDYTKINKRKD